MDGQFKAIRIRGKIEGFLFGIVSRLDTQFDDSVWESHYRSVMLYCSFPLYSKERVPRNGPEEYITGNFNHETQESIMGHDIEFPESPSGAIVFEDGVAAVRTDNDIHCTIQLSPEEMLIVTVLVDRLFANLRNTHVESENS